MTKITSLGAKRVGTTNDCRDWTPLDALREMIEEIESGERDVKMIVIMARTAIEDDGTVGYPMKCAGARSIELAGLISRHTSLFWGDDK